MQRSSVTYDGIMNFIIENELTDRQAILLHPLDFDSVALAYIKIYKAIVRPFEILGIEVREDNAGIVMRNNIMTVDVDI